MRFDSSSQALDLLQDKISPACALFSALSLDGFSAISYATSKHVISAPAGGR